MELQAATGIFPATRNSSELHMGSYLDEFPSGNAERLWLTNVAVQFVD